MSHISDEDRKLTACDGCGKRYPANVTSQGDIIPIGIGECRSCGGTQFTVLEDAGSQAFAVED